MVFDDLLEIVDTVTKSEVFIVPGNHDVDRENISDEAMEISQNITTRNDVIELFEDPIKVRKCFARLDNYGDFVNEYFEGHLTYDDQNYFYVKKKFFGEKEVDIIGLNSSWLSYGGEQDTINSILVGTNQILDTMRQVKNSDYRIALIHHPFYYLKEFDQGEAEKFFEAVCDFIIIGHRHREQCVIKESLDGRTCIISGGASSETVTKNNSYNCGSFDLESGKGEIYFRNYTERYNKFIEGESRSFNLFKNFFDLK